MLQFAVSVLLFLDWPLVLFFFKFKQTHKKKELSLKLLNFLGILFPFISELTKTGLDKIPKLWFDRSYWPKV